MTICLVTVAFVLALCTTLACGSQENSHGATLRLRRTSGTTTTVATNGTVGMVTKLCLVNADTDLPIAGYDPLPSVSRIDLNALPTSNLSVQVLTGNGTVESVGWRFEATARTENQAPWAMCFNNGRDIFACKQLVAGFNSNITVTPYSEKYGRGTRGASVTIQLSLYRGSSSAQAPAVAPFTPVVAPAAAPITLPNAPVNTPVAAPKAPVSSPLKCTALSLINAKNDTKVVDLASNGTSVSMKDFPGMTKPSFNVNASCVGAESVVFLYNGTRLFRVEAAAPWALCGNQGGNFWPCDRLLCGSTHTISAIPYPLAGGQGVAGTPFTATFTIVCWADAAPTMAASPIAPAPAPQAAPASAPIASPKAAPPVVAAAPASSPIVAPAWVPATTPNAPPEVAPTVAPASVPSAAPVSAPVVAPALAPIAAPVVPVAPVIAAPVSFPVLAPVSPLPPTTGDAPVVVAPKAAPVVTPAAAAAPAIAPVKAPTSAPVRAPTKAPVAPFKAPVPNSGAAVKLTIVDSSWNGVNATLLNDGVMRYYLDSSYTVQAEIANAAVQSVQFSYDGKVVRTENEAPFVLAGKKDGAFLPWIPTPGLHTLVASAYSQKNTSGTLLALSTVSFTAVLQNDTTKPRLLIVRGTERVNRKTPPSTLDFAIMARDERSGIASVTVILYKYVSFPNYTSDKLDLSNGTVRFDQAVVAATKGNPFYCNVSVPYPKDLPTDYYSYRVEVEDGAGNVEKDMFSNWFGEIMDVRTSLTVFERRVELLNVTTQPTLNPTVTVNASGLPAQVPVQITVRDDEGYSVCVSATGNGFSTEDPFPAEYGSYTQPNCLTLPDERIRGQPFVTNLTLEMRSYFPTGKYNLKVFSWDYAFDAAYLSSKNFSSVVNLVNPNVKALTPPVVKSLTALSPTTINLNVTGNKDVNVTVRLVVEGGVSAFDGEIQFWFDNVHVTKVNSSLVAGQPETFDVSIPILFRPGLYPLRLVFEDKFRNTANVSSASLTQQGFPIVVEVQGTIDPALSNLASLSLQPGGADVSYGYGRVVLSYNFGFEGRFYRDGFLNVTATGVADSNRGVMLQGRHDCHPRYGSNYPYYYCFFLNESTPLGLYLLTAEVGRGSTFDTAALAAKGFASNFTVTSYITTGVGP